MSDSLHCPEEVELGAYVLGALDPAERARKAAHLAGCPRCRHVLDELDGLPRMLARVPREEAEKGPPKPSEDAFERLASSAARHRSVQRRRRAVLSVAAALVVIGGVWGALWANQGDTNSETVTAQSGAVRATVVVSKADKGSRLELTLWGVPSGQRCQLVAIGRDGHEEVAGTWIANYTGGASHTGWAPDAPDKLARLVVESVDGTRLVALPLDR